MTKLDGVVPWPADLAHAYRAAGCWQGRTLGSYLWEWAGERGDRIAVVDGGHRLTYRDLAVRADALAERLSGLGLGRGDTALVQLPNCWEFVVTTLACWRLGVVPVMMLPPHREYELTSIGAHVGAGALIVPGLWRGYDHQELAHRVRDTLPHPARVLVVGDDVRPDSVDVRALIEPDGDVEARRHRLDRQAPDPSDVAVFLLSGGTTGVPKVIGRTHDDYLYNIRRCAAACGFGPDTVYLTVLPAGHNFPLANPGILGALFSGGRAVLLPSPRPDAVFEAIETERVTATSAVPAVALKWMEAAAGSGRDLSSLRYVHVGGSMLSSEVAARIGPALGCRLQQVYGMAEGLICYTPLDGPDEVAHATQGAPISPFDELLVVGPDGAPVPPGEAGELLTRGPYTPRGYYGVPVQNRLSFTPDGWYRTGDLVRITPEGNVVVCGRVKDQINRGGEKISAGEIETLVQELPQVAEAAAVAMPDPELGERVCVFVRLHPGQGLTLAGTAAALTARGLAAFKIPERLEVLDEIPHTPVGKPDKKALQKLLLNRV
ncbi:AMP-binding protein [Nonomuraea sp. B12E4]|uniref:(2,3-dihydroxybenzoyl)adenylate synthase n=1 Tax=Nonomuraea sp. B12E4 TaxID=3153564 RepID=UPI00325DB474